MYKGQIKRAGVHPSPRQRGRGSGPPIRGLELPASIFNCVTGCNSSSNFCLMMSKVELMASKICTAKCSLVWGVVVLVGVVLSNVVLVIPSNLSMDFWISALLSLSITLRFFANVSSAPSSSVTFFTRVESKLLKSNYFF